MRIPLEDDQMSEELPDVWIWRENVRLGDNWRCSLPVRLWSASSNRGDQYERYIPASRAATLERQLADMTRARDALTHDIARHVAIAAEHLDRADRTARDCVEFINLADAAKAKRESAEQLVLRYREALRRLLAHIEVYFDDPHCDICAQARAALTERGDSGDDPNANTP